MRHALILEDNMVISRAIQERLTSLGFNSFDHAWTEDQAVEAAKLRSPTLVVIGDSMGGGFPQSAAERISNERNAPILMIAADRCRVRWQLPEGASLSGPFLLNEIETAVALACSSAPVPA